MKTRIANIFYEALISLKAAKYGIKRLAAKHLTILLMDFIVIFGTAAWWTGIFQSLRFYHYPIIVCLLRWKKFDRNPLVKIVYLLITILFAGTVMFSFFPLICVSKPSFFFTVSLIFISFFALHRNRGLTIRTFAFSFIAPLIVSAILVERANRPCAYDECAAVRENPNIRTLIDLPALEGGRGLPRFMVYRKELGDLIVAYRTPYSQIGKVYTSVERYDFKSGKTFPARHITDEPIGLLYDRERNKVFLVTANKFNHENPKTLLILDEALNVTKTVPFPHGEDDDYTAHMMFYKGKIAVRSEGEGVYLIDPDTYELTLADPFDLKTMRDCRIFDDTGFAELSDHQFIVSGVIDPLIYSVTRSHGVCKYDLDKMEFTGNYRPPLSGAWDLAFAPDRKEIFATSAWWSKMWVISSDTMRHVRTLDIGPCLRPVAYDQKNKFGYTAECFSGYLDKFDVDTGKILDRNFIGKNSRKIYVIDDLGTIVLSGCGVFLIEPDDD